MEERYKKDSVEQVKQEILKKQIILTGSIKPKKNHILYEIDLHTKEISLAEFELVPEITWQQAVNYMRSISINKKVIKKDNCIYISAMNIKSVNKILNRDYKELWILQ